MAIYSDNYGSAASGYPTTNTGAVSSSGRPYPVKPDTSYLTYLNNFGLGSGIGAWFSHIFGRVPKYEQWAADATAAYNNQLAEYNALQSEPISQRAMLEAAGYNPNYGASFSGTGTSEVPSGPNLTPSGNDTNPISLLASVGGIVGQVFQTVQAIQGIKMMNEQIRGQQIVNTGREIDNASKSDRFAASLALMKARARELGIKSDNLDDYMKAQTYNMGYRNDALYMQNAQMLRALYGPDTQQIRVDYNGAPARVYDTAGMENGLYYQREVADIDYRRAARSLVLAQREFTNANTAVQKIFKDKLQPLQIKLMTGELKYQDAIKQGQIAVMHSQVSWQDKQTALYGWKLLIDGFSSAVGAGVDIYGATQGRGVPAPSTYQGWNGNLSY